MIRNVIFDMGKVMLDYNSMLACYRHARDWDKAAKLKEAIFDRPEWWELVDGGLMTDAEYAREAQSRLDDPELKELAEAVLGDWWADSLFPVTGIGKLIEDLLDAGVKLYVLSNVGYSFHEFSYKIPHLDRFSGIVLSCEEKLRKPDPEIFRRLCSRYGVVPEETLFVDDHMPNVESARSIGLQGYCFADTDVNRLREHLAEALKPQA